MLDVFAALVRHTLLAGDARALTQWLRGAGALKAEPGWHIGAALAGSDADAAQGVLTGEQMLAVQAAPALEAEAARAAEACAVAVLGCEVLTADARLRRAAGAHAAFGRDAAAVPQEFAPGALTILRETPAGQKVLCLINVTPETQLVPVPWRRVLGSANVRDLVGGVRLAVHGPSFELDAFEVRWLAA
jgi:Mrp family chromosome partitioning ATPase